MKEPNTLTEKDCMWNDLVKVLEAAQERLQLKYMNSSAPVIAVRISPPYGYCAFRGALPSNTIFSPIHAMIALFSELVV